ncbi:gp49 [Mycolicibacter sinensis]|uniref:Gp49 n=2 Tax=Mycobacteriaceae TaxID=1762 RepID=F5YRX9_MYCSD|nr:gp49 [Mycolicibacter sinensis]
MLGTSEFVWPTTNKIYRSRSTAKKRAELIESFGATAAIERSSKITWPHA